MKLYARYKRLLRMAFASFTLSGGKVNASGIKKLSSIYDLKIADYKQDFLEKFIQGEYSSVYKLGE